MFFWRVVQTCWFTSFATTLLQTEIHLTKIIHRQGGVWAGSWRHRCTGNVAKMYAKLWFKMKCLHQQPVCVYSHIYLKSVPIKNNLSRWLGNPP